MLNRHRYHFDTADNPVNISVTHDVADEPIEIDFLADSCLLHIELDHEAAEKLLAVLEHAVIDSRTRTNVKPW